MLPALRPVALTSRPKTTTRFVAVILTVVPPRPQTRQGSKAAPRKTGINKMRKKSITRRASSTSAECATSTRCTRTMTRNVWTKIVRVIRGGSNRHRSSTRLVSSASSGSVRRTSGITTSSVRTVTIRWRRRALNKEITTYFNRKVASVAAIITIGWRIRRRWRQGTIRSSVYAVNVNKITTRTRVSASIATRFSVDYEGLMTGRRWQHWQLWLWSMSSNKQSKWYLHALVK